jgi:hypothetical protein
VTLAIAPADRDLVYSRLKIDLYAIEDLMPSVERREYEEARRLASKVADALRLIATDLRWGAGPGDEIALASPPDLLLRVLARLEEEGAAQPGPDVGALKLQLLCIGLRGAIEEGKGADAPAGEGRGWRIHLVPHSAFPTEDEAAAELTVFSYVLGECPTGTSIADLLRQMLPGGASAAERSAAEVAVKRLVARGTLRTEGELVLVCQPPEQARPEDSRRQDGADERP